jgi:ABC-2 type transport system permease protein
MGSATDAGGLAVLLRLMQYEWRNLSADRTPLAIALLLGLALSYGAWNGWQWMTFQRETIAAAQQEERERLAAVRSEIPKIEAGERKVSAFTDSRLPQVLGRGPGARYAVMPPGALGALAVGQSDLYPYYFKVTTGSNQTFLNSDEIENPVHLLAGRFDLAFVLLYLLPLVILACSYNLVSAEKEGGTLALALSQPIALPVLTMGKLLPRVALVLGLAVGLPVAMVGMSGGEGAGVRLWLWVAVTVAYSAFWFALAVAVNAWGRSSATNAMALAGLWLLLVVVVPAVLNVAVKTAYPVPSRVELIQATRVAGDTATRQGAQLLARYLEDHPEMAPADKGGAPDFGTVQVAVSEATERAVQPVLDRFDAQVAGQQRIVDRFRFLSPAIVAQSAFNDLAGASAERYSHFLAQADVFHQQWRGYFVPRILRKEKLQAADVDQLPVFTYRDEALEDVVGRLGVALLGLLAPTLLVGWLGWRWLGRYPIAGA